MIVCVCRRISDRQVRQAAAAGACSTDGVFDHFGTEQNCGTCLCEMQSILAEGTTAGLAMPFGMALAAAE